MNLIQSNLQTMENLSLFFVNVLFVLKKKKKNCHIQIMGNTRHINEPNNISLNYRVASTHFRFFFLSIPLNHKKTLENGNLNIKRKWNKFYYFF